ncbi:hypothetical protein HanPI659440_Chr05g0207301 [Helianthus annuus]|nr:hypothetical protein HanPI659440_Chr05g0207301 [Helianthus annuus]
MFLTLFRINRHCSMHEFQSCFQDVVVSPPSHTHIQDSLPLFIIAYQSLEIECRFNGGSSSLLVPESSIVTSLLRQSLLQSFYESFGHILEIFGISNLQRNQNPFVH